MKTEISRDSHQPKKRYSGVYQQQGRMLTDADWNELVEIIKDRLDDALKDVVGSKEGGIGGTPRHRALKIIEGGNETFKIQPGHVYVDGVAAQVPGDTAISYNAQPDFPGAPDLPTSPQPINYVLYADVWERTVTHLMDERLRDKGLHGADTCTRKQMMAQVKWCPDDVDPEEEAENPGKGNAELTATLLRKTTQPDSCDPCAGTVDVDSKVGNYLFRVEVHDVKGNANNPDEITLKWSSENGAEQFEVEAKDNMPAGFVDEKFVYEFFSETSEKHLGVHLDNTTFPDREILYKDYPDQESLLPDGFDFVRRWDGYATFTCNNGEWSLDKGISGNIDLTLDESSTKADKVLKLDSVELKLQLLNRVVSGSVTEYLLVAHELIINNIPIPVPTAGSDTKSEEDNAVSAIAKAKAISDAFVPVTDDTRVWAIVNPNVVEGVPPSAFITGTDDFGTGDIKINNISVGAVTAAGDQTSQADAVKNAINSAFPEKEIVASKTSDDAMRLVAADGRNIDIKFSGDANQARCGLSAETYYSTITLASRSAIKIEGIEPDHAGPGHAGFVTGTTPAVKFVAGDYWLADVREAEHEAGSVLIEDEASQGIEHHYLTLGTVIGVDLQPNQEADRKYAFPPLTEMTRMFMAGGDGQEVVLGDLFESLPQPLRVAVANGEWPVKGATVHFQIVEGEGSLDPTDGKVKTISDGIAECIWKPGITAINPPAPWPIFKVQAMLVDPDDPTKYLEHPPVYFYANLVSAEQVAYTSDCPDSGQNAVHSHLAEDTTLDLADGYHTVKEVLDGLLCDLKAKHIPYTEPTCVSPPSVTVKSLLSELATGLDFDDNGHITVSDILDTILCKLRAKHIPYDPTNTARWNDINVEEDPTATPPETVQEAIDDLLENLQSEDIKYPLPDCNPDTNTLKSYIAPDIDNKVIEGGKEYARIKDLWDALLCHLDAAKVPLDKSDTGLCSDFSNANTVQEALKVLCDRPTGGGCAVTVGEGGIYPDLKTAFKKLKNELHISICLLPRTEKGTHVIEKIEISGKQSISITGHDTKVFLKGRLFLEAANITLRGIHFTTIEEKAEGEQGTGNIILSSSSGGILSSSDGNVVVKHCQFVRGFSADPKKWQPFVTVNSFSNIVRLHWHGNRMLALRVNSRVADVALPKKQGLRGKALEAYHALETVLKANPYDEASRYEEKVKNAAEKLIGLSSQERTKYYDARYVSRINKLSNKEVEISRLRTSMLRTRPPVISRLPRTRSISMMKAKPKTEVTNLYEDIKSASATDVDKLVNRINIVVALTTSIDDALSLTSNYVGGDISNNIIYGRVVLFNNYKQGTGSELNWGSTQDNDDYLRGKITWSNSDKNQYLDSVGMLNLHDNLFVSVRSMVSKTKLEKLVNLITDPDADSGNIEFAGYSSMSVRDNYFGSLANSFIGRSLKLSGNEFPQGNEKGEIVAYAMGYYDIFVGNLAYDEDAVIEQISKKIRPGTNTNYTNMLKII